MAFAFLVQFLAGKIGQTELFQSYYMLAVNRLRLSAALPRPDAVHRCVQCDEVDTTETGKRGILPVMRQQGLAAHAGIGFKSRLQRVVAGIHIAQVRHPG